SSAAYGSATLTATLTLAFSSTDGSMFWIKIVSSATPITMGTSTLDKITSPSYSTPGGSVSVTGWSSGSGSTLNASTYIDITFSADVSNADNINNYQINYGGAGSIYINSASYDSGSHTATLTVICSYTDGSTVSFSIIDGGTPISSGSYAINSGTSPSYYTPDTVNPQISSWSPTSGSTISSGSSTIQITYTENVTGAGLITNFTMSGTATGSITGITYDSGTYTTTLTINATGTAATVNITVVSANITDSGGNVLSTAAATFYLP
ncbi:MAG TPA: hypothetical protein PK573_14670, partial [Spirochaetota bacterium]|nr:hypothetical protein [Spirochaetota bacterium]